MAKRDIRTMRTDLSAFAAEANLPSQHTDSPPAPVPAQTEPTAPAKNRERAKAPAKKKQANAAPIGETRVAITIRNDLHMKLKIDAAQENTSVAALILKALQGAGYDVADEEIRDKRRG